MTSSVLVVASTILLTQTPSKGNFVVHGLSQADAQKVAVAAEKYRAELAEHWLGKRLPRWKEPCPITVQLNTDLSGTTSFTFDQGEVFGWEMMVRGPTLDRVIAASLPHEIMHTVLASHFRRKVPRWFDEAVCTLVEDEEARKPLWGHMVELLNNRRRMESLRTMMRRDEYPPDAFPLYTQSYWLIRYLQKQGQDDRQLIDFMERAFATGQNETALQEVYGIEHYDDLERKWMAWLTGTGATTSVAKPPLPKGHTFYYFTATWCGPCKQMRPHIDRMRREGWQVQIVDIDRSPDLKRRFGVTSIPAVVYRHPDGKYKRLVGVQRYGSLMAMVGEKCIHLPLRDKPRASVPIPTDDVPPPPEPKDPPTVPVKPVEPAEHDHPHTHPVSEHDHPVKDHTHPTPEHDHPHTHEEAVAIIQNLQKQIDALTLLVDGLLDEKVILEVRFGEEHIGDSVSGTFREDGNPFVVLDLEEALEKANGLGAQEP